MARLGEGHTVAGWGGGLPGVASRSKHTCSCVAAGAASDIYSTAFQSRAQHTFTANIAAAYAAVASTAVVVVAGYNQRR